jgi:hypothetical protein
MDPASHVIWYGEGYYLVLDFPCLQWSCPILIPCAGPASTVYEVRKFLEPFEDDLRVLSQKKKAVEDTVSLQLILSSTLQYLWLPSRLAIKLVKSLWIDLVLFIGSKFSRTDSGAVASLSKVPGR